MPCGMFGKDNRRLLGSNSWRPMDVESAHLAWGNYEYPNSEMDSAKKKGHSTQEN